MITWRQQTFCTIMLILARMFADDPDLERELKALGTSIRARNATEFSELTRT